MKSLANPPANQGAVDLAAAQLREHFAGVDPVMAKDATDRIVELCQSFVEGRLFAVDGDSALIAQRKALKSLVRQMQGVETALGMLSEDALSELDFAIRAESAQGPLDYGLGAASTWAIFKRDLEEINATLLNTQALLPKGKTGGKRRADVAMLCFHAARVWRDCLGHTPTPVRTNNGETTNPPLFQSLQALVVAASGDKDMKHVIRRSEYNDALTKLLRAE
jgi:hypothetical protein